MKPTYMKRFALIFMFFGLLSVVFAQSTEPKFTRSDDIIANWCDAHSDRMPAILRAAAVVMDERIASGAPISGAEFVANMEASMFPPEDRPEALNSMVQTGMAHGLDDTDPAIQAVKSEIPAGVEPDAAIAVGPDTGTVSNE